MFLFSYRQHKGQNAKQLNMLSKGMHTSFIMMTSTNVTTECRVAKVAEKLGHVPYPVLQKHTCVLLNVYMLVMQELKKHSLDVKKASAAVKLKNPEEQ